MCKVVEVGFGKTSSGIMALGLATAAGHKFILAKISIRRATYIRKEGRRDGFDRKKWRG